MIDTALGVKVLRVGCQAVESGVRTSNGSSIGFEIGRKQSASFFTFIEEASNVFLEKVHPLHKGGRKAADEVVLAPTLR